MASKFMGHTCISLFQERGERKSTERERAACQPAGARHVFVCSVPERNKLPRVLLWCAVSSSSIPIYSPTYQPPLASMHNPSSRHNDARPNVASPLPNPRSCETLEADPPTGRPGDDAAPSWPRGRCAKQRPSLFLPSGSSSPPCFQTLAGPGRSSCCRGKGIGAAVRHAAPSPGARASDPLPHPP
jgi:hypothetical protein